VTTGEDARRGLFEQVPNPVRWADTIHLLFSLGVTRTIEVGAGAVLTGLLRNIQPEITGAKFGEASDWEKLTG
jgi:[acyl-carrier-protein] S-malonyltransferase